MDNETTNTVPNLDAMCRDDLMEFWSKFNRPSRKDAEKLIGDTRRGYTVLAGRLAAYAANKAAEMRCREAGKMGGAESYNNICDNIYNRLPQDLKW